MKIAMSCAAATLTTVLAVGWGGPVAAADSTRSYLGPVTLNVDLRDAPRKIFRTRESIPVSPGPLTLY